MGSIEGFSKKADIEKSLAGLGGLKPENINIQTQNNEGPTNLSQGSNNQSQNQTNNQSDLSQNSNESSGKKE